MICVAHFHCVKLCYKQRDKIGFLRITSGQFEKSTQPPMVTWKALLCNGAICCFPDLCFSFPDENAAFNKKKIAAFNKKHLWNPYQTQIIFFWQSLATKLVVIVTNLLNIFLLNVNFNKSTIGLLLLLISFMLAKFQEN